MDGEIDIRAFLGLLRRESRLIALTSVVVFGIATLIVLTATPIYTATTLVMVDPSSKNLLDPDSDVRNSGSDNARVDSEVELVRSENVLLEVIDNEGLAADPEFAGSPDFAAGLRSAVGLGEAPKLTPDQSRAIALANLESNVTVQRRGLTYLIAVGARSSEPAKAARLANAIASTYIENQINAKVTNTLQSRDILLARVGEARDAMVASEGSLADFVDPLDADLSAEAETEVYELQQNADIARRQYETLLDRSQSLEAQSSLQIADSRVVSEAIVPGTASWPNTRLILLLAAIAALGLGVGLAFLRENFIGGITSEDQAFTVLRTKVAATLPRLKLASGDPRNIPETIVTAPLSVFSEAIRRIRAALDQNSGASAAKPTTGFTVMVTSTAPGEGKTSVALSLARSYALAGQSTLLIDCDLRKPDIGRQMGIDFHHGLIDWLTDADMEIEIRDALVKDSITDLMVVSSSRRSGVVTDQLIAGAQFTRLLEAARSSFNVIVLDTPPLSTVVDGMYLARHASAIVFVARWAATSQSDIKRALATLNSAKPANTSLVAVINQQEMPAARGEHPSGYQLEPM